MQKVIIQSLACLAWLALVAWAAACGGSNRGSRGVSQSANATDPSCNAATPAEQAEAADNQAKLEQFCPPVGNPTLGNAGPASGMLCLRLGDAYENGKGCVARDLAKARRFYASGCALGYQPACAQDTRLGFPLPAPIQPTAPGS